VREGCRIPHEENEREFLAEEHRVFVLSVMHGSRDLTGQPNQPWVIW
jgi:hypothetical protein